MPVVTIHPKQEHPGTNTAIIFNGSDYDNMIQNWDSTTFETIQDFILNRTAEFDKIQKMLSNLEEDKDEEYKIKFTEAELKMINNAWKLQINRYPNLCDFISRCVEFDAENH